MVYFENFITNYRGFKKKYSADLGSVSPTQTPYDSYWAPPCYEIKQQHHEGVGDLFYHKIAYIFSESCKFCNKIWFWSNLEKSGLVSFAVDSFEKFYDMYNNKTVQCDDVSPSPRLLYIFADFINKESVNNHLLIDDHTSVWLFFLTFFRSYPYKLHFITFLETNDGLDDFVLNLGETNWCKFFDIISKHCDDKSRLFNICMRYARLVMHDTSVDCTHNCPHKRRPYEYVLYLFQDNMDEIGDKIDWFCAFCEYEYFYNDMAFQFAAAVVAHKTLDEDNFVKIMRALFKVGNIDMIECLFHCLYIKTTVTSVLADDRARSATTDVSQRVCGSDLFTRRVVYDYKSHLKTLVEYGEELLISHSKQIVSQLLTQSRWCFKKKLCFPGWNKTYLRLFGSMTLHGEGLQLSFVQNWLEYRDTYKLVHECSILKEIAPSCLKEDGAKTIIDLKCLDLASLDFDARAKIVRNIFLNTDLLPSSPSLCKEYLVNDEVCSVLHKIPRKLIIDWFIYINMLDTINMGDYIKFLDGFVASALDVCCYIEIENFECSYRNNLYNNSFLNNDKQAYYVAFARTYAVYSDYLIRNSARVVTQRPTDASTRSGRDRADIDPGQIILYGDKCQDDKRKLISYESQSNMWIKKFALAAIVENNYSWPSFLFFDILKDPIFRGLTKECKLDIESNLTYAWASISDASLLGDTSSSHKLTILDGYRYESFLDICVAVPESVREHFDVLAKLIHEANKIHSISFRKCQSKKDSGDSPSDVRPPYFLKFSSNLDFVYNITNIDELHSLYYRTLCDIKHESEFCSFLWFWHAFPIRFIRDVRFLEWTHGRFTHEHKFFNYWIDVQAFHDKYKRGIPGEIPAGKSPSCDQRDRTVCNKRDKTKNEGHFDVSCMRLKTDGKIIVKNNYNRLVREENLAAIVVFYFREGEELLNKFRALAREMRQVIFVRTNKPFPSTNDAADPLARTTVFKNGEIIRQTTQIKDADDADRFVRESVAGI